MKLTVVTETFAPEINGVAMTWSHLVTGLRDRGHEVVVVRPRQKPADRGGAFAGIREVLVQGSPIPGYPELRFGWPDVHALRRELRQNRPDLVHIVTEGPLGWAAWWVARRCGIPTTSSYHTHFQHYTGHYGYGFLRNLVLGYLRAFHNRTLCTFSPTEALNEELARDGFIGLRLLPRGVDTRLFNPARRNPALRAKWGASDDSPVIIHSSRVAPEKNYDVLFQCYAAIREARPDARFVMIGDGPLRSKLQNDHPWVIFTGFVPRESLAENLASADVYVHASESETFGNVVTEAMASGLAVAGYNYAAAAKYIRNGENGCVVPLGQPVALANLSVELVRDLRRSRAIGARARQTAESISWEKVIVGFERDLLEISVTPKPVCMDEAVVAEI
jgi:glycosyltransferase involved in cell wall biosynthesis